MRQSEKIERLQPFVRAILDSENQYAAPGIRAARFIDLCAPVTDTFLVRSI